MCRHRKDPLLCSVIGKCMHKWLAGRGISASGLDQAHAAVAALLDAPSMPFRTGSMHLAHSSIPTPHNKDGCMRPG